MLKKRDPNWTAAKPPQHYIVLKEGSYFGPEHAREGKSKHGVQCTGNCIAGSTYFTTIPVKKGSLTRRSAAFREFNSDLKEALGADWKRTCFLDGESEICVLYWNRP